MTALLAFEDVALVRGGRLLVEHFDLSLAPGERLQLTGPNGSGKSSLLRLAAGLLHAAAGSVQSAEAALADESLALDRELPLAPALDFWARLAGQRDRAAEALEALGLAPLAEVPVRLLSTGQAKRATLARVAASGAKLWLLDEPLNGLDAEGAGRLAMLIDAHTAAGGAVLAASHLALGPGWRQRTLEP